MKDSNKFMYLCAQDRINKLLSLRNIIIIAGTLLVSGCATNKQPSSVFICTGLNGDAFHMTTTCKGLNNCDGELGEVTIADAMEIGLHPCKLCFPKDSIAKFEKKYPGIIK